MANKPPLLYLVHRIPYPPNKGDKLRSYNLLVALAEKYDVYLGCFIDDSHDWQYVDKLKRVAADVCALRLTPKLATVRSATGLISGQPQSVPYYQNVRMRRWVKKTLRKTGCGHAVAFSSSMAEYLLPYPQLRRVADLVDADSAKWAQYAEGCKPPMRWVYQREARQLSAYENKICQAFDAAVLVTEAETALIANRPEVDDTKLRAIENGVDWRFFDPGLGFPNPYPADNGGIVAFTGAMDYWANVDAALWFIDEVWPQIRAVRPAAQCWLVGSNPSDKLLEKVAAKKLGQANSDGVVVTGRVDDIRDYIAHANCLVAPLRIARGVQNKVLEALAMDRPLVASAGALEGLRQGHGCVAPTATAQRTEAQEFATAVLAKLQCSTEAADNGRHYVRENYDWTRNLSAFTELLETPDA